jgi:hypothetical protein
MTFVIKRGDREPSLVATLTDAGAIVDLTTATSVQAVGIRHGVVLVDLDVTATATAEGQVTVDWPVGSTDLLGYLLFEFIVTWPSGKEETFPQDGFERVRVSLDGA